MSNLTSSGTSVSLAVVESYLLSSISIMYIIMGTTSFLFNTLLFTRPTIWRQSPCIPYLLASTVANIPGIYTTILTRALAGFQIMPTYNSRVLCKLIAYLSNTSYAASTWFMAGCCWDRYLSSSSAVSTRGMSNKRTTRRVISLITIIVLIAYIGKLYCYETGLTMNVSSCSNKNSVCDTADVCVTFSIQFITPFLVLLYFGIGTFLNVRRFSRQRQANVNTVVPVAMRRTITAKDHSILRVVLAQAGILAVCLLPLIIFRIYELVPVTFVKSASRRSLENFLFSMLLLLSNVDKVFSFYIYTLASSHFRKELKRLVRLICRRNPIMPLI